MHIIINILPGLAEIFAGILALLLLWSPVIYFTFYLLFSLAGKKNTFYRLLSKVGFKPRYVRQNAWPDINETIEIENKDPFPRNSPYKHILPIDYHTNPEYCNSPLNSSYNTIGPGSWFKKI